MNIIEPCRSASVLGAERFGPVPRSSTLAIRHHHEVPSLMAAAPLSDGTGPDPHSKSMRMNKMEDIMPATIINVSYQPGVSFDDRALREIIIASGSLEVSFSTTVFSTTDWTREQIQFPMNFAGGAKQNKPQLMSVLMFPQTIDVIVDSSRTSGFGWSIDNAYAEWDPATTLINIKATLAVKSSASELLRVGFQLTAVW